jgi:hypothetical protein
MAHLIEGRHAGEGLLYEAENYYSREAGVLAASEEVDVAGVLGRISGGGAVTVTKTDVAGANKGVLTLANPAHGAGVKAGTYRVVFVEPAADAGTFVVEDPDGIVVGRGTVGVAFDAAVKFTIADGATDFLPGEQAQVHVAIAAPANFGQWRAWDPDATDGSQVARAVAYDKAAAPADGTAAVLLLVRHCTWRAGDLTFKAGITPEEKALAIAQLIDAGITTR